MKSSTNEKLSEPPQTTKRYSKSEVMDIIKDKTIKNETELIALAATQTKNGRMSLENFVANTPQKVCNSW